MVQRRVFEASELTGLMWGSTPMSTGSPPPSLALVSAVLSFQANPNAPPHQTLLLTALSLPPFPYSFCQRRNCCGFLWERRDLRRSESADLFPAPRKSHNHRCAEAGETLISE